MSDDHDDIRQALDEYASGAPDSDPGAALPATLARRRQVRLMSAAGVALTAVIAVAGFATLGQDENPRDSITAAEGDPEPFASEAPSMLPSPSSSASASASAPTAPLPSATVVPSSTAWEGARRPGDPPVEELVASMTGPTNLSTFQAGAYPVTASDPYYWVSLVHVSWGDGDSESPIDWLNNNQYPYPCTADDLAPKPRQIAPHDLQHAWRHPGTYVVEAIVSSWRCGFDAAMATRHVRVTVVVQPGEISSNGPRQPELSYSRVSDNMATTPGRLDVGVHGNVEDPDGHLTSVTIDWGDGSTTTLPANSQRCSDGSGRYYPEGEGPEYLHERHDYAVRGEYTVVIRMASTGCDGLSLQETSHSFVVGSPTSPSPSATSPSASPPPA